MAARRSTLRIPAPAKLAAAASIVAVALGMAVAACGGGGGAVREAALSGPAAIGEKAFHDVTLSASGRQSCASCHDAQTGHAGPDDRPAQPGGVALERQGRRNAPGLRYLRTNTAFHFDDEGTPTGGFFWDGRAASLQAQAAGPLLDADEMANASRAEVIARLAGTAYADEFRQAFGDDIFERPDDAFDRLTFALQQYQLEDREFHAFTSKFDQYLRGAARLTPQERRGLRLFEDPAKGNCAACHPSSRGGDGSPPLFTDFTYDNLGLPRNRSLAVNADPAHYDLGLCARPDGSLADRPELCGAFKVPSLRNVALRKAYFHNGVFTSLKDAVTFYVQRDTHPERWYPKRADGTVDKFDDLPPPYHANVNTDEAPYDRRPGDAPALDEREVDDIVAFLRTLSDGYVR
jgi:cytochrome c peroxidase